MHTSNWILHTKNFTLPNAHCILQITQSKLQTSNCTTYTLYTLHSYEKVHTKQRRMTTYHWTMNTEHLTLNTEDCTLFTVHCTLQTENCTLHTAHCTLYTSHWTLPCSPLAQWESWHYSGKWHLLPHFSTAEGIDTTFYPPSFTAGCLIQGNTSPKLTHPLNLSVA